MNWKQAIEAYSDEFEYSEPSNMDKLSLTTETNSPLPRKLATHPPPPFARVLDDGFLA